MDRGIAGQIKSAIANLNPQQVREMAERPLAVGLVATTSAGHAAMEDFLAPPEISRGKRFELVQILHRVGDPGAPHRFDLEIWEKGLPCPEDAFCFDPKAPMLTVHAILRRRRDLSLALSRRFHPFRKPVMERIIRSVSRENALFSIMAALPNVVPSIFELPWAFGEFASDTAFLTMNQVRMAFLIAVASDHAAGYKEQRAQIASIVGGAVGWRSLARELVGKVPFGGGLVPKAAIAYAGTYVVGLGLERFYRIGYGMTRAERRAAYEEALERGREVVASLLRKARTRAGMPRPRKSQCSAAREDSARSRRSVWPGN